MERGSNQLIQLLVQIVMARLLAPEQFGALAIMLVFVNIGNCIAQSGLNTALVQSPEVDDADCSTVFWLSFGIAAILYGALFIGAPVIAEFYGMPDIVWPLRVLCLILPINAFNAIQVAIVQRGLDFRKVFNSTMVAVTVSGVLGIVSALLGAGIWALVVQQLAYQLSVCVALGFQVHWFPKVVFDAGRARSLFGFGWKLLVSGLIDTGYQSLSDLVIGKQFSTSELGLVSQGKKYPAALGLMIDGAIQPVMLSAVAQIQDDVIQVKRLVRRALKTSTYLIVPCMTLFAVAAEPIVSLLLGERWLSCVPFLQMYCFVYALLPIHTTNLQALNGMGRSGLFLKLEIIKKIYGVGLLLFAAFVLQDIYLMVGAYMVTGVISTFVNAWPNKKVIGYSYGEQLRDIAPAFALAAVSAVVTWPIAYFMLPDVFTLLIQTVVFFTCFLSLSRVFHVEALECLVSIVHNLLMSKRKAKPLPEGDSPMQSSQGEKTHD